MSSSHSVPFQDMPVTEASCLLPGSANCLSGLSYDLLKVWSNRPKLARRKQSYLNVMALVWEGELVVVI